MIDTGQKYINRNQYKFELVKRGRKLTGQFGDYELIYELKPFEGDESLFTQLSLAYDVRGRFGFLVVVYIKEAFNSLRYLQRALVEYEKLNKTAPNLTYVERFKVAAEQKGDFDYFGIYKIKIPKGIVVTAL